MEHKHYIRINKDGFISKAFSDAFEQPTKDDIFIKDGGRHYNMELHSEYGVLNRKYIDKKIVEVEVEVPVFEETVILKKSEYDTLMANVTKVASIETELIKAKEDIVSIKTVDTLTKSL